MAEQAFYFRRIYFDWRARWVCCSFVQKRILNILSVSIIITTRNEEGNIARCLESVQNFDEVIVVDSHSTDQTLDIVKNFGARIVMYQWNGQYPKKRQWCLNSIQTKYDYILFLDADEVVTSDFIDELKNLKFDYAGYFIKAKYLWRGKVLNYGLKNNKLALFDKNKIEFPVIDDLDIAGMGEIEGHYQPVLRDQFKGENIAQLKAPILHYAYDNQEEWQARHQRYAQWEAEMIARDAYPKDPVAWREILKQIFRKTPCRDYIAFIHSYFLKLGFLDGRCGFDFSKSRYLYYQMVAQARKEKRFKNQ